MTVQKDCVEKEAAAVTTASIEMIKHKELFLTINFYDVPDAIMNYQDEFEYEIQKAAHEILDKYEKKVGYHRSI